MGHHSSAFRVGLGCVAVVLASATLIELGNAASGATKLTTNNPGIGTQAALDNPMCDPETGRMRLQSYSAPLCVKAWEDGADNGGATAQGVTAETIKVVALYGDLPPAQLATRGLYTNQATGENSPTAPVDSTKDQNELYKHVYETWGRTVEFEFVKASGSDEASQRADAVEVASRKPFAVMDLANSIGTPPVGGGAVFQQALDAAGVPLVVSTGANEPGPLSRTYSLPTAEFVGKQLKGGKAIHADESMQNQSRKFGVLHPNNFDYDYFEAQLAKYGVKIASEATYNVPPGEISLQTTSAEIDQQIPPLIAKLKADGVNNVIWMTTHGVTNGASKAMKDQEWFPEITLAAFPYTDLDILVRNFDQEVWSHAFGLLWFLPGVEGGVPTPAVATFQWFWGTDQGTRWDGSNAQLGSLYSRLQFAGPNLTRKTVDAVPSRLRKANAGVGGFYSDSALTFESPPPAADNGVTVRGAALGWWDPNDEGPGNYNLGAQGKGQYQYLDGGKRYIPGEFPNAKKTFFDPSNSTGVFERVPASEPQWPTYPCEDCPSSGNNTITAASGGQT